MNRRDILTQGIVGFCGVGATLLAPEIHQQAELEGDWKVTGEYDEFRIQRISSLHVYLKNEGKNPIIPKFSTIRQGLQTKFYWEIRDGPEKLEPGEESEYRIVAPTPGAAIPYSNQYVLFIQDSISRRQVALEREVQKSAEIWPIRNPEMKKWMVKVSNSQPYPYGWNISLESNGEDQTELEQVEAGAKFSVKRGDKQGPWTMIGLAQKLGSPAKAIKIKMSPSFLAEPEQFPSEACGLEIIDRHRRIWIVLANSESEIIQKNTRGELDYFIKYVPSEINETFTEVVDIKSIYDDMGWDDPNTSRIHIDGNVYSGMSQILHPFVALYPSSEYKQGSMTLESVEPKSSK
ncbi:hypothetical protein [Halogeometricum sp. CBA1124]|uniref:hypothetical protein n=1 Tax=Halogeometricum sp. CBA1124 TaxID=2668071 RepID=UPI0014290749|nr:hypothetical protein [Halogeometricum sp. CBA1124]MUV57876.1 hypothetical protein [Halogeometricum sp. CBA1124]